MCDYCPDCGSKVYNGVCTWCHEEMYIADQYMETDGSIPESFMPYLDECEHKHDEYIKEYPQFKNKNHD